MSRPKVGQVVKDIYRDTKEYTDEVYETDNNVVEKYHVINRYGERTNKTRYFQKYLLIGGKLDKQWLITSEIPKDYKQFNNGGRGSGPKCVFIHKGLIEV